MHNPAQINSAIQFYYFQMNEHKNICFFYRKKAVKRQPFLSIALDTAYLNHTYAEKSHSRIQAVAKTATMVSPASTA